MRPFVIVASPGPRACSSLWAAALMALAACGRVSARVLDPYGDAGAGVVADGPSEHDEPLGDAATDPSAMDASDESSRCAPSSLDGGVSAAPADTFVDFVGVGLRLSYPDTRYTDEARVRQRIAELGVRHVIDLTSSKLDRLRALFDTGAHSLLIDQNGPSMTQLASALGPSWEGILFSAPSDFDPASTWAAQFRKALQSNVALLRADPSLAHLQVLTRPFNEPYNSAIGDIAPLVTYGAVSPFPGTQPPESSYLDDLLVRQGKPFVGKPLVAMQGGYSTGGESAVSEIVQGKYDVRLLLTLYSKGAARAYLAQLLDWSADKTSTDANLGLVRDDGTAKPSFVATASLIALLADPGDAFAPTPLAFSFSRTPDNLRFALFQQRNAHYFLVAWLAGPSNDVELHEDIALQLASGRADALVYHPEISASPVNRYSQQNVIPLELSDWPRVIELIPWCP